MLQIDIHFIFILKKLSPPQPHLFWELPRGKKSAVCIDSPSSCHQPHLTAQGKSNLLAFTSLIFKFWGCRLRGGRVSMAGGVV